MTIENKEQYGSTYFAAIEDGKEIGEVNYYSSPGRITITHVGIDPRYRGGGKARDLMMQVVEYCRNNGLKITPVCSFARATFERYPEIGDVLYKQ